MGKIVKLRFEITIVLYFGKFRTNNLVTSTSYNQVKGRGVINVFLF